MIRFSRDTPKPTNLTPTTAKSIRQITIKFHTANTHWHATAAGILVRTGRLQLTRADQSCDCPPRSVTKHFVLSHLDRHPGLQREHGWRGGRGGGEGHVECVCVRCSVGWNSAVNIHVHGGVAIGKLSAVNDLTGPDAIVARGGGLTWTKGPAGSGDAVRPVNAFSKSPHNDSLRPFVLGGLWQTQSEHFGWARRTRLGSSTGLCWKIRG